MPNGLQTAKSEAPSGAVEPAPGWPQQSDQGNVREKPLADLRFRALLGGDGWAALPDAVQRRFSKRVEDGVTVIYSGAITKFVLNRAGWMLCQLGRLIGGPLPLSFDTGVPTVVTVTEDMARGGQVWTRLYTNRRGFPQVSHSSKRFAGPTGLEEHVGRGVGMTLKIAAENGMLVFRSARFFVEAGRVRFYLPRWLSPGALRVTHRELTLTRFEYALDIVHPLFGHILHQAAEYEEGLT